MNTYMFKTTATMKEYNSKKWWIDPNIIRDKYIKAENVNEAIKKYKDLVRENECVIVSDNAIRHKEPMYIDTKSGDTKQTGYVITAKMDFQDDYGRWTEQYIDLWVNIVMIVDVEF